MRLPFDYPSDPTVNVTTKRCRRHDWLLRTIDHETVWVCGRCGRYRDEPTKRRNKNNRSRGGVEEREVARLLGGRKVGQLGLPWDVEVPGYARIQVKKLERYPSLSKVVEWLDAMGAGPELRAVTIADTPGPGGKVRRLIVMDAAEYGRWHGGGK